MFNNDAVKLHESTLRKVFPMCQAVLRVVRDECCVREWMQARVLRVT